MSAKIHETTRDYFETLAQKGVWPSKYKELNAVSYNFFTRREAVAELIEKDFFPSVLDIGCGTGDYCELLSAISNQYVGVDFSASMIEQAHERFSSHPKKPVFKKASAESLPFPDDQFDLVCAIGFIEYFADPGAPLKEISRVLKPGGTLVIQSYQVDLFKKVARVSPLALARTLLHPVKLAVLGRKANPEIVDMPYTKPELDELIARHGFELASYRYNNFHVLPRTLRGLFSKTYIAMSERITRNGSDAYKPFAVNYIGRYTSNKGAR